MLAFQKTNWNARGKFAPGPIFDVDNMMRVYPYDQNLWPTTVEADVKGLTERIKGAWENRETSPTYMQILTAGPQVAALKC